MEKLIINSSIVLASDEKTRSFVILAGKTQTGVHCNEIFPRNTNSPGKTFSEEEEDQSRRFTNKFVSLGSASVFEFLRKMQSTRQLVFLFCYLSRRSLNNRECSAQIVTIARMTAHRCSSWMQRLTNKRAANERRSVTNGGRQ
jgi:hypothetical protein